MTHEKTGKEKKDLFLNRGRHVPRPQGTDLFYYFANILGIRLLFYY